MTAAGGLEMVTVTTLSTPWTYRMSLVYFGVAELLMWCSCIRKVCQRKGEGAVVCPELDGAALHLEPEVPDGSEGSQKSCVSRARLSHLLC